jgi:hypothetical protein
MSRPRLHRKQMAANSNLSQLPCGPVLPGGSRTRSMRGGMLRCARGRTPTPQGWALRTSAITFATVGGCSSILA